MYPDLIARSVRVVLVLIFIVAPVRFAGAQAIPVEVVQLEGGGWQLLRGGEPYFIKGGGGDASKVALAAAGGNTFRTWGVDDDLGEQLDEAHRLGLAVIVGNWLGHERHGFDYNDFTSVAEQYERVRSDVLKYKDHPALLMWGIGNEAEGFEDGGNPAIWSHVQALAAMVKQLDPNHPTMSVTADIGGRRIEAVHRLCPDIDVMGINSYGGLPSIPERYRAWNGIKPIVITEFGPPGTWEVGRTSFGAPPELTSTEKAAVYREAFTKGCLDADGLCLGGFAFAWGFKMEATSTWFGMFLPNGDKLAAVDAMTEIWSGKPPPNLCPEVRSFGLKGSDVVNAGDVVEVELDIVDPEGADVTVTWEVRGEASTYITGGDAQATPLLLDGVITAFSSSGATLKIPGGGVYRLYMTATDGSGGGATANVPIKVEGEGAPARIKLPLALLVDAEPQPWSPSGWMGGHDALTMNQTSKDSPHSGETCLEVTYSDPGHWVGVVWQHPADDWGDKPGGYNLTGANKLTFWARGKAGGEKIDFGVGIVGSDKPYPDTVKAKLEGVKLKKDWKQYTIDLKGEDLTRVKSGFFFSMGGRGRPITFYSTLR